MKILQYTVVYFFKEDTVLDGDSWGQKSTKVITVEMIIFSLIAVPTVETFNSTFNLLILMPTA